jgi:hypothetical protein
LNQAEKLLCPADVETLIIKEFDKFGRKFKNSIVVGEFVALV